MSLEEDHARNLVVFQDLTYQLGIADFLTTQRGEKMTDSTTDTSAAIATGVAQAVAAAAPAIAEAAAATNPKLQLAIVAAQALEPAVAALVAQYQAGNLTQDQLNAGIAKMKFENIQAHADWLSSVQGV